MRFLDLGWNGATTANGWREFSLCLHHTASALEKLSLFCCNINEEGGTVLGNALVDNRSLRVLDMAGNNLTDEAVIALVDALSLNTRMSEMKIGGNDSLTMRSWTALSNLLCNASSIESMIMSNHTLHTIYDAEEAEVPVIEVLDGSPDLEDVLFMNEDGNKVDVVRQKIIQYYFMDDDDIIINIKEFVDMEMNVLPRAISWIGRNGIGCHLMYELLRSLPTLFDKEHKARAVGQARRKRTSFSIAQQQPSTATRQPVKASLQ